MNEHADMHVIYNCWIELNLISFLRVKVRPSVMKRETPPPVLFGLILYS